MEAPEIYVKQLLQLGKGRPLWDADPHDEPAVEVGDVGYIENDAWIRLFNASLPCGKAFNKLGVPDRYDPLQIGEVQERTLAASLPFMSESVTQIGTEVGISGGTLVTAGGGLSFECSKEQGAVLILGDDADRQDALDKGAFARYIRNHHATWLEFANKRHDRSIRLNDLVLVTGCDKTSAWACAAFSGRSQRIGFTFNVGQAAVVGGGVSIWGSWDKCRSVEANSGPRKPVTTPAALTKDLAPLDITSKSTDNEPTSHDLTPGMRFLAHLYALFTLFLSSALYHVLRLLVAVKEQGHERQSSTRGVHCDELIRGSGDLFDTSSHPVRNQCVFMRGFKICDRKTWLARRLWRNKFDGFKYPGTKDDKDDPGMDSSRSPYPPSTNGDRNGSQSPSGRSTGPTQDGASGSNSAGNSQTQRTSGNAGSPQYDDIDLESVFEEIDEEMELCFEQEIDKELTPLDVLLDYIMENSRAELALVHDDDLIALLGQKASGFVDDFTDWIRKASPEIFMDNQVGMLETTYRASLFETMDDSQFAVGVESNPSVEIHEVEFRIVPQHHGTRGITQLIMEDQEVKTPSSYATIEELEDTENAFIPSKDVLIGRRDIIPNRAKQDWMKNLAFTRKMMHPDILRMPDKLPLASNTPLNKFAGAHQNNSEEVLAAVLRSLMIQNLASEIIYMPDQDVFLLPIKVEDLDIFIVQRRSPALGVNTKVSDNKAIQVISRVQSPRPNCDEEWRDIKALSPRELQDACRAMVRRGTKARVVNHVSFVIPVIESLHSRQRRKGKGKRMRSGGDHGYMPGGKRVRISRALSSFLRDKVAVS